MIINLDYMKKPERKEPPADLVQEAKTFYLSRLVYHGYLNRDQKSFDQLANYFAQTFAGIKHEIKGGEIYSGPKHGLLVFGPCGAGKTLAMSIFSGLFKINFVYSDELIEIFATKGESHFWEYINRFKSEDLIIDDIGSEREVKSYGNASPIVDFIYRRERLFQSSGVLTHFTTNCKGREELLKQYGERAVSRILGMCKPISIRASDGRLTNLNNE